MDRGKIRNRSQAQQIRDFSGLRWGNITPTDMDAFIEYQNKAYILIEIKFGNSDIYGGQQLAFERLVNDLKGKPTILILARHDDPPETDIDAANCKVVKYYFRKIWHKEILNRTLKEFCDWFIEYIQTLE